MEREAERLFRRLLHTLLVVDLRRCAERGANASKVRLAFVVARTNYEIQAGHYG
ncbi:MAG: hypothetical protein SNJ72_00635 [Fimbriimonadales bacterium]